MKKRVRRPPKRPPNLAAKALGSKIFGLKVVSPKRGYRRKAKHRTPIAADQSRDPSEDGSDPT
jgi:hypothetical protein